MADDTRQNEETLWVLRAQTGDFAALESLLATVEAPLYRYVASLVGEPARAADVLQETFVRIWRKLVWLRDPSLFRPWAYRIASHEAFRSLSRDRRWNDMADGRELEALAAPEPPTLDPGLRERLAGFVRALPPASRAVILLVYFEDFTLAETAAVLGVAAFFGGAVFELAFLAALLLTADLSSRLDRLVVIGAVGSYTLVLLGLVAVAAYINRSVLRVLRAIDVRAE